MFGGIHCGEFACQSSQSRRFDANFANRANLKINKLHRIRGLRLSESPFLRQIISRIINELACLSPGTVAELRRDRGAESPTGGRGRSSILIRCGFAAAFGPLHPV